jgi:hypothetical protein
MHASRDSASATLNSRFNNEWAGVTASRGDPVMGELRGPTVSQWLGILERSFRTQGTTTLDQADQ